MVLVSAPTLCFGQLAGAVDHPAPPFFAEPKVALPLPVSKNASRPAGQDKPFRWFELNQAVLSGRGRWAEAEPTGTVHEAEMQHKERFEGFFKADAEAKYTLHVAMSSGYYFSRSYAETGWGKLWYQEIGADLYARQFYGMAKPIAGLELSAGSLPFERGAVTEAISYDEDGWITGERVTLKRPKQFFFDKIAITSAWVGDYTVPNFFKRMDRMAKENYHQALFAKTISPRVMGSVDYTFHHGQHYVRVGTLMDTKGHFIDHLRAGMYVRPAPGKGAGFEVGADKRFGKRAFVQTGFVFVDQNYANMLTAADTAKLPKADIHQGYAPGGNLNADRFTRGHAPYLLVRYALTKDLELEGFAKKDLFQEAFQVKNANVACVELVYDLKPFADRVFHKIR
jgi:hypothetical protein